MVKNKTGGNRHKKMARKNVKTGFIKPKIRLVKEDGEMYGKVTEFYGNGAKVLCNDNKERFLVIRRKFRGRNKRDNTIAINTMVMVGIRDWECRDPKKIPKCDLLFVYGREHINELKKHAEQYVIPEDVKKDDEENNVDFDINADKNEFQNIKLTNTVNDVDNKVAVVEKIEEVDWDDI
ncbi:MAG: hypothetical protein CML42_06745 [Rhodobacteraceae bacterium]|nr:hypothetical protein [Paracoccaceae bacterium]|tara:strand:- start:3576 stop:4112 length:537 start_codon:yes stop_codon:yes gene_type:complete